MQGFVLKLKSANKSISGQIKCKIRKESLWTCIKKECAQRVMFKNDATFADIKAPSLLKYNTRNKKIHFWLDKMQDKERESLNSSSYE